jgi:hypothetical protein
MAALIWDKGWDWVWPKVGSAPITQGLDTEMFDRVDYPYSETFVREAVQNSLDARLDPGQPVIISFRFHRSGVSGVRPFLSEAIKLREAAGLSIPEEWLHGKIKWLTIEDFNAKGLLGNLTLRTSDFWNYWLNFGVSNKDGSGRGGRGIGRVTFLIASRMQTVIGLTRRCTDGRTVACGMSVLRLCEHQGRFRTTHAYLASEEDEPNSVFRLHDSDKFVRDLESSFAFSGYAQAPYTSGLALAIPYPHSELGPDGILASTIEHFAPAIMDGSLVVKVDSEQLDAQSIQEIANRVARKIHSDAIREDVPRYLGLIGAGLTGDLHDLTVTKPAAGLKVLRDQDWVPALQARVEAGDAVALRITLPLERNAMVTNVSIKAVIAAAPRGKAAIDRLYREGMSLPDVKARNPGELDTIIMVDDPHLATYLNLCEGKAHLDLLESTEVRAKLSERGYDTNFAVKRFVKNLPAELRKFLTREVTEPDANVFDTYFAVPTDEQGKALGKGPKGKVVKVKPVVDPPPPRIPALIVDTLADGFKIRANPKFSEWPVNFSLRIAYADGTRRPPWTKFDFQPSDLKVASQGCDVSFTDNKLQARNCEGEFSVEITGFDSNRELDTRIRSWKNAQEN